MNIQWSRIFSTPPPSIQAQAEKISSKDPDPYQQDRFLTATVDADGATRMEKLVALTTRVAGRKSETPDDTSRIFEWGITTLATGAVGGPTGVVLGTLGRHCVGVDTGGSRSLAVGDPFLERIAKDQDSTPLEKTVATMVRGMVNDCGSDSLTASRIQGMGLDWLSSGVHGSTGKVLGELGVFASHQSLSKETKLRLQQDVLSYVASDPGSTPAEAEIASKALRESRGAVSPEDVSLGALLKLHHGESAEAPKTDAVEKGSAKPQDSLETANANIDNLETSGKKWAAESNALVAKFGAELDRKEAQVQADLAKWDAETDANYAQVDADLARMDAETEANYAQVDADLAKWDAETDANYAQVDADLAKWDAEIDAKQALAWAHIEEANAERW